MTLRPLVRLASTNSTSPATKNMWKHIVTSTAGYDEVAAVTSDEALEAVKRLYGPCRIWGPESFGFYQKLDDFHKAMDADDWLPEDEEDW